MSVKKTYEGDPVVQGIMDKLYGDPTDNRPLAEIERLTGWLHCIRLEYEARRTLANPETMYKFAKAALRGERYPGQDEIERR